MEVNVINEIQKIDRLVAKKMFEISKIEKINVPPSPLQFKIIDYILNNKDRVICQKDLEEKFNVSRATISGALLTMEKKEIIERISSVKDARSKNIMLTDKSIERFNEMKNIITKMNNNLLKDISKEDFDIFLKVLDSMRKNLDKFNG